jgi:hypothetical protein
VSANSAHFGRAVSILKYVTTEILGPSPAPHDINVSPLSTPLPVHTSDRSKVSLPSLRDAENLQPLIYEHSTLRGLRLCSRRMPCRKRLCPWCSTRKASEARAALRREAAQHATVVNLVLSVSSSPSLEHAWQALAAARQQFTRSRWLSTKSTSWFRQTEVTHTEQGWHLHDNWLIFGTPEQQCHMLEAAIPRWISSASVVGERADPMGQHATRTAHKSDVIGYVVKGIMAQHDSHTTAQGRTPGDLLALFHAGDADAADAWRELELAFLVRGHRWVASGGALRGHREEA